MRLTRREVFRLLGATSAVWAIGCGDNAKRGDAVFSADELTALRAFADVIIPPDDQPGGADLGAVEYIERLINAFDTAVPEIFAGGPFSDRSGSQHDDFATFLELDRVKTAAWRIRVLGDPAPNEALLGPVVSLRDQLTRGLDAAIAGAGTSIAHMTADERATLFDAQPDEFRTLMIELVTEAAFAAPEYGGNPGGAGWQLVYFPGDQMPLGYSLYDVGAGVYRERADAPVTTADPGGDPLPLDDDTRAFLAQLVASLGGMEFP